MSNFSKSSRFHTVGTPVKGHGIVGENLHDAYRLDAKLPEPTYCPDCGAVYEGGRWQWKERLSPQAPQHRCAACQRIHDHFPAGYVQLDGDFVRSHRDEVLALVRHRAEHAKAEHPMQRIMATTEEADGLLITTTDVHLARALGEAVHRAYKGELRLRYSDDENLLRVHWHS